MSEVDKRKALWAGAQAVVENIASQMPGSFEVDGWWSPPHGATRLPAEYEGDSVKVRYRIGLGVGPVKTGDRHYEVSVTLTEVTEGSTE